MKLSQLMLPWVSELEKDDDVLGLSVDSRLVKPGFIFFAYQGEDVNGADYIESAIDKGAIAVLTDSIDIKTHSNVPIMYIENLQQEIGKIASRFYGYPSEKLMVTGVTGTNGKTTIAYLLMQAYELLGEKGAYIGTLGMGDMVEMSTTEMTTPGPLQIQKYCAELVEKKYQHLAMEVSSHALAQGRVNGVKIEQAIFTNLTHDHLDYHETMQAYIEAKAKLFQFQDLKSMIMNVDDLHYKEMLLHAKSGASIYRYSCSASVKAEVRVKSMKWALSGMFLQLETPWGDISLQSVLLGDFNVSNILAVFTALMAQGFELNAVVDAIGKLKPAPGRMQVVSNQPLVVVDYAHTPDALQKALQTLRGFQKNTGAGQLWVVFGCGGDRDPFKRPEMGLIAQEHSDNIVVTSDNPRNESPEDIIKQIISPLDEDRYMAIVDRKLAIISCLEEAKQNDIILIAGKGHENYQIIGTEKIFFSDQQVVQEYLEQL